LICAKGKIRVNIHCKMGFTSFILEEGEGTLIDSMEWDSQQFLTKDTILIVLSNTEYNEKDYINNYEDFLKLIK
jgi:hypothetical protein